MQTSLQRQSVIVDSYQRINPRLTPLARKIVENLKQASDLITQKGQKFTRENQPNSLKNSLILNTSGIQDIDSFIPSGSQSARDYYSKSQSISKVQILYFNSQIEQ